MRRSGVYVNAPTLIEANFVQISNSPPVLAKSSKNGRSQDDVVSGCFVYIRL